MHRLDLGLYSHLKEFWGKILGGMESEPMLTPGEKAPLLEKFSPEEYQTHAASSGTVSSAHYQQAIPAPWI